MNFSHQIIEDSTYNGWKNRETWNVALWLQNDYPLYQIVKGYKGYASPYLSLRDDIRLSFKFTETRDGVSFWSPDLDIEALDEMINEAS